MIFHEFSSILHWFALVCIGLHWHPAPDTRHRSRSAASNQLPGHKLIYDIYIIYVYIYKSMYMHVPRGPGQKAGCINYAYTYSWCSDLEGGTGFSWTSRGNHVLGQIKNNGFLNIQIQKGRGRCAWTSTGNESSLDQRRDRSCCIWFSIQICIFIYPLYLTLRSSNICGILYQISGMPVLHINITFRNIIYIQMT